VYLEYVNRTFLSELNAIEVIPPVAPQPSYNQLQLKFQTDGKGFTYMLHSNRAVIFKFSELKAENIDHYFATIHRAYDDIKSMQIKNLIIDLTDNGGGELCFAPQFTSYFVKEWDAGNLDHQTNNFETYDFRTSPLTDRMVELREDFISPSDRFDPQSGSMYTDYSFYNKIPITRGDHLSYYSKKVYYPNCYYLYTKYPSPKYYFDKIIIITDGGCASTCSQFALKMNYYGKATIFTHGGLYNGEMDFASIPGGDVIEWSELLNNVKRIHLPSLPNNAVLRFNFNEIYYGDDPNPAEFYRSPPQYHSFMWDAVFNNDPTTPDGLNALGRLYSTVDTLWDYLPSGKPEAENQF